MPSAREALEGLTKEQLVELVQIHAKNAIALDGVWFQSVERACGMDAAMEHDVAVWARCTESEAQRLKAFLGLGEHPGLDGLERALSLRINALANEIELHREGDDLLLSVTACRVQAARLRKHMGLHPCKPAGEAEFSGFARGIDERITCTCVSCYPDAPADAAGCTWRFSLHG